MTFKAAATYSLLLFVAVTCVVLIVKRLPQAGSSTPAALAMQDGVSVYYLHGNTRCPTCRSIEAYAQEAVQTGFAEQLQSHTIEWQVINYEAPGNEHYVTDYQVVAPYVVLVKFVGGKQTSWQGLPEVWQHVGDKSAFLDFVQDRLREFLQQPTAETPITAQRSPP